jgi:hypothetical protein
MALNSTETARLADLVKIPVAQRTPAQTKEISDLQSRQNS